ncbi:hypothetical protein HYR99_13680 [Candidatus Poribacteria bacterium]|nr:hypothetical protein [Candidatus Poribacteria bacterium]
MAKYDPKNQKIDTQYNAGRDIVFIDRQAAEQKLAIRKDELTDEAKEILVCAYKGDTSILLLPSASMRSKYVCAGDKAFFDKNDPDSHASYIYSKKYCAALQLLHCFRYVDCLNSQVYELNYDGIQKAQELVGEPQMEQQEKTINDLI